MSKHIALAKRGTLILTAVGLALVSSGCSNKTPDKGELIESIYKETVAEGNTASDSFRMCLLPFLEGLTVEELETLKEVVNASGKATSSEEQELSKSFTSQKFQCSIEELRMAGEDDS